MDKQCAKPAAVPCSPPLKEARQAEEETTLPQAVAEARVPQVWEVFGLRT